MRRDYNMTISRIVIKIKAKHYCIDRLSTLGYQQQTNKSWVFNGAMHRYTFQPADEGIIISIMPKLREVDLIPEITFEQIYTWVFDSLVAIGYNGNRNLSPTERTLKHADNR